MPKFDHHIFICQNTREPGHPRGSCNSDGKSELLKLFKESVKKYKLDGKVRPNKAGCLDHCEHGSTVVIYPEAVWYGGVKPEDVDEIVEALVDGHVIERLKLKDNCINTPFCEHKPKKPV